MQTVDSAKKILKRIDAIINELQDLRQVILRGQTVAPSEESVAEQL
jgi:hypothetical protein